MTADPALLAQVKTLSHALQAEPLFHVSLGSKELFHSNFLAWFADRFPLEAAAAFRPWGTALPGAPWKPSEREPAHLDLVLHLPDLQPMAIENKVFSVPDEKQLDKLSADPISRRESSGPVYGRLLLSLMSPGWREYDGWRFVPYEELANTLEPLVPRVRSADSFAGDLLEHYVTLVRPLVKLIDLLGTPDPSAPLLLPPTIVNILAATRVSAAVQKARASSIARDLRQAVANKGWTATDISHGFTRTMSLLEGYRRRAPKETDPTQDALGWQIQGEQFRLVVAPNSLGTGATREERETYVIDNYLSWFDFAPLEKVAGTSPTARVHEFRGGRWSFQGFGTNFVSRYRLTPDLTPAQLQVAAMFYLDRAGQLLP